MCTAPFRRSSDRYQVSQFNQYSRVWNVILQSDAPFRQNPRRHHQALHPVEQWQDGSAFGYGDNPIRDRPRPGAAFQRFSRRPGHRRRRAGYSSGDAIKAMEEVAERRCRRGMTLHGRVWHTRRKNPAGIRLCICFRPADRISDPGRPVLNPGRCRARS